MTALTFTFEKLGIKKDEWDINFSDNRCSYAFSTPTDGVLLLKSSGRMNQIIIARQIQFIENYHIKLNNKLANYKSVLIWDCSEVSGINGFVQIVKLLEKLSVDILIVVPGKLSFHLIIGFWVRRKGLLVNLVSKGLNEAVSFARRVKENSSETDFFSGRFAEYWSRNRKTKKIGKRVYRYLELPDWQYESADKRLKARVVFFENRTILYEISGRAGASDVQALQQRVVTISNQLEVDIKRIGFYVIFDVRKLKSFDPDARKLMRKMEQNQHHLSNGVVVLGNRMIYYLLGFRKKLHPNRYDHWNVAGSLIKAFTIIELEKVTDETKVKSKTSKALPADNYKELKKQYQKLQSDYNILSNTYTKSLAGIRQVLSYVNSGDFLMTPFKPRFGDVTIEGEVYNTFAILHEDLKKNRNVNIPQNFEINLNYNNVEKILNAISVPAFIFSNMKILFANDAFAELIGSKPYEIKGQPLASFVHTYDLNRVERYLAEVGSNSVFECDAYNSQSRTITITMSTEYFLIDGVYSQFVFVETQFKAMPQSNRIDSGIKSNQNIQTSILNKSLSGVLDFYLEMLNVINKRLFSPFLSPESYNPNDGAKVLANISEFVRKIFIGYNSFHSNPDTIEMLSIKETIDSINNIFVDYLNLTRPEMDFRLTGNVPIQKLGLVLQSFWVEALLVRVTQLFAIASNGTYIEMHCRSNDNDNSIEISLLDDGPNINLFSLDKYSENGRSALKIIEIDQFLKQYEASLILESTLEQGNTIRFKIPVIDRGIGYDDSLMDLSYHNILVFDSKEEHDIYNVAMKETGAKLIYSSDLQDALNILANDKISLIFLDVGLPESDISLFVSRVQNEFNGIPIIGLAKQLSYQKLKNIAQSSLEIVMDKPINVKELKKTIKHILT